MTNLDDTRRMTATGMQPEPNGDSFDALLTRRARQEAMVVIRPYLADIVAIKERQQAIDGDPFWHIRSRPELLTISEVAGWLKVHSNTIYGWIRLPEDDPKHLPVIDFGTSYRVAPADLADWLARNRGGA